MALFGRNRHDPVGQVAQGPIGPAGWSALPPGQVPFERDFTRGVDLINWSRHWKSLTAQTNTAVPATSFRDCYSTLLAGRPVTIANGWTRLGSTTFSAGEPSGCSVVAVQLPALVPLVSIRPQRFPDYLGKPTLYTGDPVFDGRFAVCGDPGAETFVNPAVRQRIMAHDDWFIHLAADTAGCIGDDVFHTADEASTRVAEMIGVVAALPGSLVPQALLPQPSASAPTDVLARLSGIRSMEDGVAFLQQLTPAERDQLRSSSTPLAQLADVRTPQEAIARFTAMDPSTRAQIMAMFMQANPYHP